MITITTDNFEQEVLNSSIPVVVDFWADWCGPCKMLSPTFDEIAKKYDGKVKFGKINIDEQQDLAMRYGIMSIPTIAKFTGGELAAKSVGVVSKDALISALGL